MLRPAPAGGGVTAPLGSPRDRRLHVAQDRDKQKDWEKKVGDKRVGNPFSTERELVEEGKEREGTNLDLGEERSEEQEEEIHV